MLIPTIKKTLDRIEVIVLRRKITTQIEVIIITHKAEVKTSMRKKMKTNTDSKIEVRIIEKGIKIDIELP